MFNSLIDLKISLCLVVSQLLNLPLTSLKLINHECTIAKRYANRNIKG